MSQLDIDVALLTTNVAALTTAVNTAIVTLQTIANESTDDAAVKAANIAIQALTVKLNAAPH